MFLVADTIGDIVIHHRIASSELFPRNDTIRVNVTGEYCSNNNITPPELAATALFAIGDADTSVNVFAGAAGPAGTSNIQVRTCSNFFYVWGTHTRPTTGGSP